MPLIYNLKDFKMSIKNYYVELLVSKYKKTTLTRIELAKELNVSVSTLERLIEKDMLEIRYKRFGNSQKAKYLFPVVEVANYLSFQASVA